MTACQHCHARPVCIHSDKGTQQVNPTVFCLLKGGASTVMRGTCWKSEGRMLSSQLPPVRWGGWQPWPEKLKKRESEGWQFFTSQPIAARMFACKFVVCIGSAYVHQHQHHVQQRACGIGQACTWVTHIALHHQVLVYYYMYASVTG